jgi:hypothetical protein
MRFLQCARRDRRHGECDAARAEDFAMAIFKKLINALYGVKETPTEMAPPLDCDDCRLARAAGKDACLAHHHQHPRAHTYSIGGQVEFGGVMDHADSVIPHSSQTDVN